MADGVGSAENGNAYADALARARQIAAKLGAGGDDSQSLKRPFDGGPDSQPDAKKMATSNDHINAQLQSLASQSGGASSAAALAAAAASQINAKLGVGSAGPAPVVGTGPDMSTLFGVPFGPAQTEITTVPDRMVGLIIGKGGEQIAAIQAETECRIQFAPDSGGQPNRQCTLTGNPAGIAKARETIQRLVAKIQGGPLDNDGPGTTGQIELMVPGGKVGLIIGKSGETIKQIQERAGVKIVVIQDTNTPTSQDKPVRITGDRQSCLRAKDMLLDLLAEKDLQGHGHSDYNYSGGGQGQQDGMEVPVPRSLIGVIIGKGGDMIKKIQEQSGSRIQFKPEDEDTGGPTRMCSISGSAQGNQTARQMILELIENGMNRQGGGGGGGGEMMGGMGRGRGRGMDRGGFGEWGGGGPGGGNRFDGTTYIVPADKCGLVIGKGGDTIREINRQSGAHCELNRDPPPNQHERMFRIQGNPEQVQAAIRLINEKTGQPQMPEGGGGFHGGPQGGPMGAPSPMGASPYGMPNAPGPGGMMPGQQPMPPPQHMPVPQPQTMMPQQPAYGGAQPWTAAAPYQAPYGQMGSAMPAAPDPAKQASDPNAAAWAAYYAQVYGQAGGQGQQAQPQQPPQQQPQQPVGAYGTPASSAPAAQPQPTINPQTGQPDYSAAWAEYYRQQGMHQHAQAILQAAQQSGGGAGHQVPQ